MDENKEFALVSRPPSAVEKTAPGAKHILSGMVADTLALRKQAALSTKRFRIGDYEWCEPDYGQILIWAQALSLRPEDVVVRLQNGFRPHDDSLRMTQFTGGRLVKIRWDFELLPMHDFQWVEGLETTHLSFSDPPLGNRDARSERAIKLPLPHLSHIYCVTLNLVELDISRATNLTYLSCFACRLPQLDLSQAKQLRTLECMCNQLSNLDLSELSNLVELHCAVNQLRDLDLSGVPRLTQLTCQENKFLELDLSKVPLLESLACQSNPIRVLDIRPLLNLKELRFDAGNTRLIQRPDQKF